MSAPPSMAARLKAVEDFNRRFSIGDPLWAYRGLIGENPIAVTLRTAAELLSGHTPVAWVNGTTGCIALTHLKPRTLLSPEADEKSRAELNAIHPTEGAGGMSEAARDALISRLARVQDQGRDECPACGRMIVIAGGYWTQHSDPAKGVRGNRRCSNELTPHIKTDCWIPLNPRGGS